MLAEVLCFYTPFWQTIRQAIISFFHIPHISPFTPTFHVMIRSTYGWRSTSKPTMQQETKNPWISKLRHLTQEVPANNKPVLSFYINQLIYLLQPKSNHEKLTEVGFLLSPISVNPPWEGANPTERIECNDWRMEFRRSRRSRWRWRDLLYQKPAAIATNRIVPPTTLNAAIVNTSLRQPSGSI